MGVIRHFLCPGIAAEYLKNHSNRVCTAELFGLVLPRERSGTQKGAIGRHSPG